MSEITLRNNDRCAVGVDRIEFRPFTRSDAQEVYFLAEQLNLGYWSLEDYLKESEVNESFSLVALFDKELIGFIVTRLITYENINNTNSVIEANIYNIGIKHEFRRFGVGAKLLDLLKSYISNRQNRAAIWLEVRESNRGAIEFYRANGFEIISCRKAFYKFPTENALVLKAEIIPQK